MNYKSISDISTCIRSNIHKIPQDVDLIVGIPRSGLLAGSVLALHLNIPIVDLVGFVENRKIKYGRTRSIRNPGLITPTDANHILIVDDSVWSGKSMATAVKMIEAANHGVRLEYFPQADT
jgi:adenine/guanine phosphoribosyltransferase-like PRPP-binding protein